MNDKDVVQKDGIHNIVWLGSTI